jgi:hypothetical protein
MPGSWATRTFAASSPASLLQLRDGTGDSAPLMKAPLRLRRKARSIAGGSRLPYAIGTRSLERSGNFMLFS